MNRIDIVVPIYNAYDYTEKCIDTVIKNTNLLDNTLVLINDKSTDNRILSMLSEFKIKYNTLNIVIVDNKENCGFVKTVNIGMSYSKNDVVILNSDTEVTERWLEKLADCAYSEPLVATVTPLSNNATLASIPNVFEDNELPENITLENYSKIIEDISLNEFPQIPTGNGFCMYMTRDAIDAVGLFDDITFEKGYGEENDFCYRCLEHGFKNLLCDNTFIYHKGTQSFSKEKEEFINSHLRILQEKYPICYKNTDDYCRENPNKYIQKNIIYEINSIDRKNILFIVHDFRPLTDKNLGGTTLHIYDLIKGLRNENNIHVLYPGKNNYEIISFFKNSITNLKFNGVFDYGMIKLYNQDYKELIEEIISNLKIDLVHIHHLKNQYLDVFDVVKEKKIPLVITLHDFYSICPTIQLLNDDNEFCKSLKEKDCSKCLKKRFNINSDIINIWQREFHKALNIADKIIVPSENTKKIILDTYENLEIDVIEHGITKDSDIYKIKNIDNDKFNIAFLGGISEHKGINILKGLVDKVKNTDINVHLFGTTSNKNYNINMDNYIYHGIYEREEIRKLLIENDIKLVCLFSIWPETYSYTLTESLISNVPVITFNIGAIADRLSEIDGGYIINNDSSVDYVYKKIQEIRANKEEYSIKLKNIKNAIENFKNIEQMDDEYINLYQSLFKIKKENNISKLDKKRFYCNEVYSLDVLKLELNKKEESILEYDKCLRIVNERYNSVVNSKRWKYIGAIRIPKLFSKIFNNKGGK